LLPVANCAGVGPQKPACPSGVKSLAVPDKSWARSHRLAVNGDKRAYAELMGAADVFRSSIFVLRIWFVGNVLLSSRLNVGGSAASFLITHEGAVGG
jgi:hypothetical protein